MCTHTHMCARTHTSSHTHVCTHARMLLRSKAGASSPGDKWLSAGGHARHLPCQGTHTQTQGTLTCKHSSASKRTRGYTLNAHALAQTCTKAHMPSPPPYPSTKCTSASPPGGCSLAALRLWLVWGAKEAASRVTGANRVEEDTPPCGADR